MRQLGKRVEVNANKNLRSLALLVDQTIVMATPVDTGRARSNWRVSIGSPDSDIVEPYSPGKKGSTSAQNTQAALGHAQTVIARYTDGGTIWITNNVKYIGRLNEGYSAQAPAQFVEQSVQTAVASLKRKRLLRK